MSQITVSHVLSSPVATVMRRMTTKNFGALLRALDEHLKTGEDIPRGWQPVRAA